MALLLDHKLFVWDLHGVLEKNNEYAVVQVTNEVLARYDKQFQRQVRLDLDGANLLYGRKWHEYFQHLLPEASPEFHEQLQKEAFEYSNSHPELIRNHIRPTRNSRFVLGELERGHSQILISNTLPESLDIYMDILGLHRYFPPGSRFAASAHTEGSDKKTILKRFLDDKLFQEVIIIGDSDSDIDLCSVTDLPCTTYLYTHQGLERGMGKKADYRINSLALLLEFEL